jgi:hypothetical protein
VRALYASLVRSSQESITKGLERVRSLRAEMGRDVNLAQRVHQVKLHQHRRFERDYADLLASARYGSAARFFMEDLYGPTDFSARDAQFGRVVPNLVRVLPTEVVCTVERLIELHGLSEELDHQMARAIGSGELDEGGYAMAWRNVGRREDRARQVDLMLDIGRALDRHTRSNFLGTSLRLMRGPARAAGLEQLQRFLEAGFSAFAAMGGAGEFLNTVAANERKQIAALFDG